MKTGILKPLLAASAISLAGFAAARIYDLHTDFAREANPHKCWSYGYSKTITGFEAFTSNRQVEQSYLSRGQEDLIGWSRPDAFFPYVGRNDGTTVMYQRWRPGDILLCPNVDLFSIVRWTNPARGTTSVRLYVTFRRVENVTDHESQWYVVANGKVIDTGTLTRGNEERSVTELLDIGPGGSISLVVGCKDHMEGTGLSVSAVIKPVRPPLSPSRVPRSAHR